MNRFLALLAAVLLSTGRVAAQAPLQLEGKYATPMRGSSAWVGLEVILLDPEKGIAAVSTSMGDPPKGTRDIACGGEMEGLGQFSGNKLVIEPYEQAEAGKSCRLTATFSNGYRDVRFSTNGECADFSGWSCEWEGLKARKIDPWKR